MRFSSIVALFCTLFCVCAQDLCTNPDVVTQQTIGNILACTVIEGDLTIGNITSAQLQLPFLQRIHGNLNIINVNQPGFTNLDGLMNLFHVRGNVTIVETSLLNIKGLAFLNTSGINYINVLRNNNLTEITGFAGVKDVTGAITILDNYGLHYLTGFYNLERVGGSLSLAYLPELYDVLAFAQLTSIGGDLEVMHCPKVLDLEGFRSLQIIGGDIDLQSNELLNYIGGPPDYIGFGNLHFFQGSILIFNNSHLQHLDTLISPHVNYTYDIVIEDNERLANIDGFSAVHKDPYLEIEGTVYIAHNKALQSVNPILNSAVLIGTMRIIANPSILNITSLQTGETKPDLFELLILANSALTLVVLPSINSKLQVIDNQNLRVLDMCKDNCTIDDEAQVAIYNNGALQCSNVAAILKRVGAQCISDDGGSSGGVMNGGQIFGIVLGCVCGMALIVFVAYRAIGTKKAFSTGGGRGSYVRHTYQKLDVNPDTE